MFFFHFPRKHGPGEISGAITNLITQILTRTLTLSVSPKHRSLLQTSCRKICVVLQH